MNRKQRRALASQRGTDRQPEGGTTAAAAGIAERLAAAMRLHQSGRLVEAEAIYWQVCAADPTNFSGHYLLGVIAHQSGRHDAAVDLIERALAIRPDYAEAHNNLGNALRAQGRLAEAVARYERALALRPGYSEAHNNLGTALRSLSRSAEAVAHYKHALALKPGYAEAHNNLANALVDLGKTREAIAHYERALALKPDYAEAHNNLGAALIEEGKHADAVAHYERALSLKPDFAQAHNNLGNALRLNGRLDEAIACYEQALSLQPDYSDAHNNIGTALLEEGRIEGAITHYERALTLQPDNAVAHDNLGTALLEQGKPDEAAARHERALMLRPDFAEAHNNLGVALLEQGKPLEAAQCHERALALKPDFPEAKLALCMAQLPVLYLDEPEIDRCRERYHDRLKALIDDAAGRPTLSEWAKAVGSSQPFFLAYQGSNDRQLQSLYGSLVCRIMAERYPPARLAPPPGMAEPVRVGIVSGFFRHHSNWKIPVKGWLTRLDRQQFQVFGYHTGVRTDVETKAAAALCHRFVQGPLSVDAWREAILDHAPHVLIYPEVGMDPMCARLAAQRLAPVQCNSWGHPETSGFPTLDYFLSSDLMEPADGQQHYTERLVRLPNLSIYYEPSDGGRVLLDRSELGLRSTATVYWCGQSLFKYLPQYDEIFPRIAREVRDCQFVFIRYHRGASVGDLFRKRLERAFEAFGLTAADHCVILPRLEPDRFTAAIEQCDIFLDSIGWSGCNSTLESLPHDLPIVTMSGPLMRGRHSAAILRTMDVTETAVETVDDYVAAAIRLALDVPWRMMIKSRISNSKSRIYRDTSCVAALEQFLNDVARSPRMWTSQ